ncbi:hypothetical protein E4T38_01870 [Aureobasidium subglaciale]|nr:hypothetical protein E4T38_01870 [Aureobasidium subglaciale]KAI5229351.1 hypothetical protein E4T40_01609 [Aureobasidium subglaciale]KAI5232973.1 hypothetical protein E4T41_01868 [Aureobasidium subglaciale]KAI5266363.1 hypothetical protein E4T46_01606 [Aureobasidium subglaciale]
MSKLTAPTKVLEILKAGFHVQVLFINQISGIQEPKTTVGSGALAGGGVNLEQMELKAFRHKLGKAVDSKWSFSFENCAPVEDGNTLLYYLSLVEGNMKKLQTLDGGDAAADLATLPVLTVYMAVGNSMAPPPTGFGATWAQNKKADVDFTDRNASALIAPILSANHKAEYITETASIGSEMVPANGGMLDCVVDFSDADWNKIMMLNKTLYAFDVRGKSLEVTSARLPAFELNLENKDIFQGVHLRPFVEINDAPHIDIAESSKTHSPITPSLPER